jgi:5-methylcytosine-specific restriction endonuclease McrA
MAVFVLGNDGLPLMPCSEKRARLLLDKNRAIVKRIMPFVIQMRDRCSSNSELQKTEVKIDPGSKWSGIAIVRNKGGVITPLFLAELEHRGQAIKLKLTHRSACRRSRRSRKLRYRKSKFLNRVKGPGWLAPSLLHRVFTVMTWIKRLIKWCPVSRLVVERVKFDTQKLQNPEISGKEYRQGELEGYEVREYLLEKWGRKCAYCGCEEAPLQIEHIVAKANGGTNRVSNLTLACGDCNRRKGIVSIDYFLKGKPELLQKILRIVKTPLRAAAAVNSTRNKLVVELMKFGLPVETGTGGQTKYNRVRFNVPKTHAFDAVCVGDISGINIKTEYHIGIKCKGRGTHCRTGFNKFGFPIRYFMRSKKVQGFQSGDIVSLVLNGRKCTKRISVMSRGAFNIKVGHSITSVTYRKCRLVQHDDGYEYSRKKYDFLDLSGRLVTLGNL